MPDNQKNQLFYGDNYEVLKRYLKDESVDLIYLDPPFNSRQDYNVLFAEKDGSQSSSQIHAFEDTWAWNVDAERSYEHIVERGGRVADAMRAFRTFLGGSDHREEEDADRGIDGRLYFHDDTGGKSKQVLFSVKAGGVTVSQIRDLRGTIERERSEIGVFLCFEPPTRPMLREAAEAGLYKSSDGSTYPRLQIYTVEELLAGKQVEYPHYSRDVTFKRAPRQRGEVATNMTLPLSPGDE